MTAARAVSSSSLVRCLLLALLSAGAVANARFALAQVPSDEAPVGEAPSAQPPSGDASPAEPPLVAPPSAVAPIRPAPTHPAPGAQAQGAPPADDSGPASPEQRAKLLAELYGRLATAPNPEDSEPVAQAIERVWRYSGSATADLLFERAATLIQTNRHDLALKLLDATVEMQPDFADAWNRRAYLYFIKNDYQRALGDLRRVLALEPNHFKALEGLAQILREIGEKKSARDAFKRLLAVHPHATGARDALKDLTLEIEGQGI